MFIEQQKTRSESLVRKPGVQKTMKINCSNEAHNNASNNGGFTEVWQFNMKRMLKKVWKISRNYKNVAIDCEFPGDPHGSNKHWADETKTKIAYEVMKKNVDCTKMISLGL